MNIADAHETLSPANLALVAKVLEAIDYLGEIEFLKEHQKGVQEEFKISESEVTVLCEKHSAEFPFLFLTFNGYGYRMLTTHVRNGLKVIGRNDAADILLASQAGS